jgi:hypothetical protein
MIDPKKAEEILYKHFEETTTEQFVLNLKKYCPFVFEDEEENFQNKSENLENTMKFP